MTGGFKSGYEYLLAYKIAIPIYDYTVEFCTRCSPYHSTDLNFPKLSSPRTHDQMVQAARSGMVNISEGYKQKSLASYIKLVGVARGSIEELLSDYLSYARQHNIQVWNKERVILAFPTLPTQPAVATNLLIDFCHTAGYLQDKLLISLEDKHAREGGFNENLLRKRLEYRKMH